MNITFEKLQSTQLQILIDFLTSDTWSFHGVSDPDPQKIRESFGKGFYDSEEAQTFWIIEDGEKKTGLIRIFDLDDYCPMFDIRIHSSYRGKGIGKIAVNWMTRYVFRTWPDKWRIEGHTRHDNIAMQKVFLSCGFVKEAHHRKAWPADDGTLYDSVGYGILKEDWEKGSITPVNWKAE